MYLETGKKYLQTVSCCQIFSDCFYSLQENFYVVSFALWEVNTFLQVLIYSGYTASEV